MMTTLNLAIVFALANPGAQAERKPGIDLPLGFKVGEKYRIQVERERIRYGDGKETARFKSSALVDFEVKEVLKDGFVFSWTYGKTRVEDGAKGVPSADTIVDSLEGVRLDIRTDQAATPTRLADRAQATKVKARFLEEMRKLIKEKQEMTGSAYETMEKQLSPELVEMSLLREPLLFYLACGAAFEQGEPVEYADRLPNFLGGEPLPSKARFLLEEVRVKENEAKILWSQEIDRVKAKAVLADMVERLASGGKSRPEGKVPQVSIQDSTTYLMDIRSGWPKSVEAERTVVAGDKRQVDRWKFRRLVPATPSKKR